MTFTWWVMHRARHIIYRMIEFQPKRFTWTFANMVFMFISTRSRCLKKSFVNVRRFSFSPYSEKLIKSFLTNIKDQFSIWFCDLSHMLLVLHLLLYLVVILLELNLFIYVLLPLWCAPAKLYIGAECLCAILFSQRYK